MEFLKRAYRLENKSDAMIITTITLVSLILVLDNVLGWHFHPIYLIENQILYIFSVLAQVVGALIGISVAGYALLDSRYNSIIDADETLKEIIPSQREYQYKWLLRLVIYGLIDIVLCITTISLYNVKSPAWFDFFSDESLVIFFIYLYIFIRFTLILSPRTTSIFSDLLKINIDEDNKSTSSPASFADFITKYNQLEDLLYSFLDNEDMYQYRKGSVIPRSPRRNSIRIDEALLSKGIFSHSLSKVFNDIRKYRNALVHSTDDNKEVNSTIYNKLHALYDLLNNLYTYIQEHKSEDFRYSEPYNKLMTFSLENALSSSEKKTINDIMDNNNSSKINTRGFYNLICDGVLDDLRAADQITQEEYDAVINYYLNTKNRK